MITQKEQVFKYIQSNGYITSLEAVLKLNIIDLQSNIRDLKNDGVAIKSKWVTNRKTKKTYKVYALKQKYIDEYEKRVA